MNEAPAPIGPLAVLPVFFSLRDRAALVVGYSPAAAWKAELLAAAGASVTVVPADAWRDDDFAGVAIAVADLESEAEAARFAAAARRAGVPHNVIDKPEHCGLQFGAVVNRSPVVIGISTAGAAPVLSQAIRRRIEILLPPGLAAWAAAAQSFRNRLKSLMPSPQRRRAFWQAFAERAFTASPDDVAADFRSLVERTGGAAQVVGSVTFVGAGPGDSGLLTLDALRALQSADVILFDPAISPDVLDLARREARRLLVDGTDGAADLLLRLSRQGRRVVRLVPGDPMSGGAAGTQIAALKAAGVPVSVVPGIAVAPELGAVRDGSRAISSSRSA